MWNREFFLSGQDIFLQFGPDFINATFEWFYSLFKGDIVNQIIQFGILSFIMQLKDATLLLLHPGLSSTSIIA